MRLAVDANVLAAASLGSRTRRVFSRPDWSFFTTGVLKNMQAIQQSQNLTLSEELQQTAVCAFNLDMETGTGKTYSCVSRNN